MSGKPDVPSPASTATAGERAVCGALLEDGARAGPAAAAAGLQAAHFADANLASLYTALQARLAEGLPCDAPTVAAALQGQASGATLELCLEAAPATVAHVGYHCQQIMQAHHHRVVRDLLAAGQSRLASGDESPGLVAAEVAAALAGMDGLRPAGSFSGSIIRAGQWESETPTPADEIIEGLFEAGDKVAVIAPSKQRKSFLLLQLGICVATGTSFLGWRVTRPRRVLLVQFEIRASRYHRRFKHMAESMQLFPGDKLAFANGRGQGWDLDTIALGIRDFAPDVLILDPIWRMVSGDENAGEAWKPLLATLDGIAEKSGAAVVFAHHDKKGDSSERDIRDRGAGSGALGRDYDTALTLTPHRDVPDAAVAAVLTRNYQPTPPFTVQWQDGYFRRCDTVAAVTGRPGKYDEPVRAYLANHPRASLAEISNAVGCDRSTASRIRNRTGFESGGVA